MLYKHCLGLLLCCVCLAANGQDERFLPKAVPTPTEKPTLDFEQPEKAADKRTDVLVKSLSALLITSKLSAVDRETKQKFTHRAIAIDQLMVPKPEAFAESLKPFLQKPVTLKLLDRINRHILSWYRDNDYPVVDALTPSGQDISDGRVQITVLIAKRGALNVPESDYFDNDDIKNHFQLSKGDYLRYSILQQELDWANRNPFRAVNVQLAPGEAPGFTDLNMKVEDRLPVRVYAGIEDTGNEFTGDRRWLAGLNWGNAFGLGHQLGYQYISADRAHWLAGHSLSYSADLPWRDSVSAYASYINTGPDVDDQLEQKSRTITAGFDYRMPMLNMSDIQSWWSIGYGYVRSNNNLEFGGEQVFDNDYAVSQFIIGAGGSWQAKTAASSFSAKLYLSPGGMVSDNDDEAFEQSRSGASAQYTYMQINADYLQNLTDNLAFYGEFKGQLANDNLISSEQFGLGGYATVRGYEEYAIVGDEGLYLRSELRLSGWNPIQKFANNTMQESLTGLVFLDIGNSRVKSTLPGEAKYQHLRALGLGFRYQLSHYMTARFDYGWQLKALQGQEKDSRAHFSLIFSY